ncbi:MAG: TonB-dependent receptor plug domain-containing protein, partial [Segetibacter sp.]
MKLAVILIFSICFNATAKGYSQKLNISEKDVPLEKIFKEIRRQTGYRFVYTESLLQKAKKITIKTTNASVEEVLEECFRNQTLTFSILNNLVIIKEKEAEFQKKNLFNSPPPPTDITGTVTDDKGQALADISVLVKGSSAGTRTDNNGRFTLTVPNANSTLVFSSIGYASSEVALNGRTNLTIKLTAEAAAMQQVVVTALGIKREAKSLGYATATVSPDQVTVNRTTNFVNALEGKIAGVNITSLGSGPGGTSKIRIRGQSSFGGNNSPLIVVNGVPIDNTNFGARGDVAARGSNRTSDGGDGLSSIDPDNIESMTILKGAAASALYGSRAKDGVIMITTKTRGKGNGIGIEYNSNFTSDTPLDYTDYQYEYGQGENGVRPTTPNPQSGQWSFGEKFQPGMTQILFDGVEVPYVPVRHQITQYYRKGNSFTNTIT